MSVPAARAATERPPSAGTARWHKNGTYERILQQDDGPGGTLTAGEKQLAATLVSLASTTDADPRVFVPSPKLLAMLRVSQRTFDKYEAGLVKRRLVDVKRDRKDGAKTWYIKALVAFFAEERIGKDCGSNVIDLPRRIGKDCGSEGDGDKAPDPQILLNGPADFADGPAKFAGPDPQILPVPLDLVPDLVRPHTELEALARRLGMDLAWFEDRPLRFAAAHLVATRLDEWGLSRRRQRETIAAQGFLAVAGAVGFVLERLEPGPELALIDEPVHNPAALFETALQREWCCALPGWAEDRYAPRDGGWTVEASLWETLREMVRRRVSPQAFEVGFKQAKLRRENGAYVVVVPSAFALRVARGSGDTVAACLAKIGFPHATVTFASDVSA